MQTLLQPTYLKELCEKYNLVPSKQYGQHYLISDKPIRAMIEAGELTKDDTVVEIGPGFGVLTLAVAPLVKRLVAFEIEKKLESYWSDKKEDVPNVEIVWGNVLKNYRIEELKNWKLENGNFKLLANLPYQITSEAIRTVLESDVKPSVMIVMVQKEVAERICSKKGDMNLLALSVQFYGVPRIVAQVPAGCFWPVPKVDSAVIAIDLQARKQESKPSARAQSQGKTTKHSELTSEEFFKVARAGFSHPRKQLWSNVSQGLHIDGGEVKEVLKNLVGNEKVRAEDLSCEEWVSLVRELAPSLTTV